MVNVQLWENGNDLSQELDFLKYLNRGGKYNNTIRFRPQIEIEWYEEITKDNYPLNETNVFYGVNPTNHISQSGGRTKIEDIVAVNCLFADYDAKDFDGKLENILIHINKLQLLPSIRIFSGHGYHCFWLFSDTFFINTNQDREVIIELLKKWVSYVSGDPHASDIARILRYPKTYNQKKGVEIQQCKFDSYNLSLTYSIDQFKALAMQYTENPTGSKAKKGPEENEISSADFPIRGLDQDPADSINRILHEIRKTKKSQPVSVSIKGKETRIYKTRSQAEAGIITILILSGKRFEEIERWFKVNKPDHYAELPWSDKNKYLKTTYNKVMSFIRSNPTRARIEKTLPSISDKLKNHKLGRYGCTLVHCLLAKAFQYGKLNIQISYREIQEYCMITSNETVQNNLHKLEMNNLIIVTKPSNSTDANSYDVSPIIEDDENPTNSSKNHKTHNDYWSDFHHSQDTSATSVLWSERFLGQSCKGVYQCLTDELQTINQIASDIGIGRQTVSKSLRKLEIYALAKRVSNKWVLGNMLPITLADEQKCIIELKTMKMKHEYERRTRKRMIVECAIIHKKELQKCTQAQGDPGLVFLLFVDIILDLSKACNRFLSPRSLKRILISFPSPRESICS